MQKTSIFSDFYCLRNKLAPGRLVLGNFQRSLRDSLLDRQVPTQTVGPPTGSSTLDHVQCETGQRSLLVARLHIKACLVHRLDDLIERDLVAF